MLRSRCSGSARADFPEPVLIPCGAVFLNFAGAVDDTQYFSVKKLVILVAYGIVGLARLVSRARKCAVS